jgi:outer-membrane receptor for ferric coprogen and ferric-rhodotorulic acid
VSEAGVATKFDLPPREIPQTVVVTTQKLIKDFNLTDVKQILQFTPGIYVENERNVGAYQYFSRGYQLQVQFDGVPSAVRIGDRDAVSLDSAMIDASKCCKAPQASSPAQAHPAARSTSSARCRRRRRAVTSKRPRGHGMAAGLSPMSLPLSTPLARSARGSSGYTTTTTPSSTTSTTGKACSTAWCRPISLDEKYYSGISVPYHGQVYGDPRKATLSLRKSF